MKKVGEKSPASSIKDHKRVNSSVKAVVKEGEARDKQIL